MKLVEYDYGNRGDGPKRGSRRGYFFSGFIGAVIGALLVLLLSPRLTDLAIFQNGNENEQIVTNSDGIKTQNISLNVETDITKAVDKAADSVVGITNLQSSNFWADETTAQEAGTGSGVIYKKSGGKAFIVTNNHVVQGATELEVTLSDGKKINAKLIGADIWTDLAVVEVAAKEITKVAEFGNSDSLKAGEPVIAIGNPLGLTFSGSVTQGIISGLQRTIPVDINEDGTPDWQSEVIQTDAAINPGNSGGALVNIEGQLIGINSMKIAESAVEGIGLAIPINSAIPIIEDLEQHGEVQRPYMGVELQSVSDIPGYYQQEALKLPNDVTTGVAIKDVSRNSPAQKAGLKELDVIVELDGEEIVDLISLRKHLYTEKKIGDKMEVKYYRNGKLETTELTLSEEEM
ncbi:S1C family serine protease [Niallia circulans]|uniref:S1C family serine protease n=1 Tax=Niallia circulans TaxID=1397 RepID=UPI00077C775B|nr:trypsin-like peptidase domain-containing protein [Niallia circulans]MDR4316635.1 PDZ domain-containing protein [Niallia circulans]MED3840372.1 trypsin-like peptidase domain-containing protein [Niallia circulans]MED4242060.1 trypsin-like peptidase domain-containing protein [Niallia circulans]MED4249507.1 trypsin-like peptidase domain-containing protein [Niallia circulans]QKH59275.1 trypsin-like peptidase domain-containing protein [Niallia circulans]